MVIGKISQYSQRLKLFIAILFLVSFEGIFSKPAYPQCEGCVPSQCSPTVIGGGITSQGVLPPFHNGGQPFPESNEVIIFALGFGGEPPWTHHFNCYRHWISGPTKPGNPSTFACPDLGIGNNVYFSGVMAFAEQMTAVTMQSAAMIGKLFDAKNQMETQRTFDELKFQAHRDYHPSEDFCWFGTNVRSLAATEQKARYSKNVLASLQMSRHLGSANTAGAENRSNDKSARWREFQQHYCDPQDNNWTANLTGLDFVCEPPSNPPPDYLNRMNIDIDYTRLVGEPRTLDVNLTDISMTNDEQDIIALSQNLYGHNVLSREANREYLEKEENQHHYMQLRSVAAKRAVAENSFNAIVSMKSSGSDGMIGGPNTSAFMYKILSELGISDTPGANSPSEAERMIGSKPSYYAQMEILANKIYQNPDFYANLYDKPANVARKSVALKAVDLMLDRAIFESELRQEMMLSVLLSSEQSDDFRRINQKLLNIVKPEGQE